MAFSIESRVPFLDPTLVKFVLALPEEYFIAPDGTINLIEWARIYDVEFG